MKKNIMEGSYTVEAAFLMPIVLGIVFALLYTLFILHDRVIMQARVDEWLQQEVTDGREGQTEESSMLEEGLWCMKITEHHFKKGRWKKEIMVSAETEWNIPVLAYFMNGIQKSSWKESCMAVQPEMVMRYGLDFWKDKTRIEEKEDGTKSGDG